MAELTKIETKIPENLTLGGVHHVTAITSSAQKIYNFFTNILGLRLAKLTVNQDDYETYHLFFTEEDGHGADMTFFDFKDIPKEIMELIILNVLHFVYRQMRP